MRAEAGPKGGAAKCRGVIEGERVLGRFTVGERLGRGGHGTVHRAWDERLCRWVAVKEIAGDAGERVARECQATARLNHPSIVTLYEMGAQNGGVLLISEYVDGPNAREMAARAELSDRDVAELGAEMASALAHAHRGGVVHRDVKPDNVLHRRGGGYLLADFGIAGVADAPTLTATGEVLGTLAYMSPEQASGEKAGAESDVYSLGLTLYELWAGENPVSRATPAATARAIGDDAAGLAEVRPELPQDLCVAIDRCLAADPELRPSTRELCDVLLDARGDLHPDRAVPEPLGAEGSEREPLRMPGRLPAIAAGGLAAVVAGTVAGFGGLALVAAVAIAPALLLLGSAREGGTPLLAPLLGVLGAAPAFLAIAARNPTPSRRVGLALVAWIWTGIAAALLGRSLGVPVAEAAGSSAGWAGSLGIALQTVLLPLLDPQALAIGLTWVGGAILLGLILDAAPPAAAAIGGLLWAGAVVALSTAAGEGAVPTALLAPALLVAVAWAIWDREGRPSLAGLPAGRRSADPDRRRRRAAGGDLTVLSDLPRLPDRDARARRVADSHVRAALHGAGSRAGVP